MIIILKLMVRQFVSKRTPHYFNKQAELQAEINDLREQVVKKRTAQLQG